MLRRRLVYTIFTDPKFSQNKEERQGNWWLKPDMIFFSSQWWLNPCWHMYPCHILQSTSLTSSNSGDLTSSILEGTDQSKNCAVWGRTNIKSDYITPRFTFYTRLKNGRWTVTSRTSSTEMIDTQTSQKPSIWRELVLYRYQFGQYRPVL